MSQDNEESHNKLPNAPSPEPHDDGGGIDNSKVELHRTIGCLNAVGIIIGGIIGSGIFITPSSILSNTGSVGMTLIIWAVCGLISTIGGMCFAELGTTIPKSGGEYNYILETFGALLAFLFLWTNVFVVKPASVAIIAMTSAIYIAEPFFEGCFVPPELTKLLATLIIISITLLNACSVKWALRINNILNYFKFLCLFIIIGIGFYNFRLQESRNYFKGTFSNLNFNAGKVGSAFFSCLWAYDGFNCLSYTAEEMKNPEKNLPRSIFLGMVIVTLFYVLTNVCYVSALGPTEIMKSHAVGLTVGTKFLHKFSFIIPLLVSFCTIGAEISVIFGNGRLLFVAGREGHLPAILASIHKKFCTPIPSLFFTLFISIIMLIPPYDSIENLLNIFSFATWGFFLICFIAQIYIRTRRRDLHQPFRVWLLFPIIMCIVSVFLIVLPIFDDAIGFSIALGAIIAGIPFYFIFIRYRYKLPQRFFNVVERKQRYFMNMFHMRVARCEEDLPS